MAAPVSPDSIAPERRLALDDLFADCVDETGSVAPIGAEERAARRDRACAWLREHGGGSLLVEPGPTLEYLAGVSTYKSERLVALVLHADGACDWLVPTFEVSRITKEVERAGASADVHGWDEHEHPFAPLAARLRAHGSDRLWIEPDVRHRFVAPMHEFVSGDQILAADRLVQDLRGPKDAHEVALLRRANELTQRAIRLVSERVEDGTTGVELAEMVTWAQHRMGLKGIWNLTLIGPAAAYPHGSDEPTVVEPGAVVLIDTGGSLHGYQSDNTRTWVHAGDPTPDFARAWDAVQAAQQAAYAALRPGAPCRGVDEAARAVLTEAGYGPGYRCFTHRVGHGIGTEVHQSPYLDGGSEAVLEPGMTFSDEPGVYLPGQWGLRLEDIVMVTEDGGDHFGSWQQGPTSPA